MTNRNILFLCTGNSCRSQMAEGIMNKLASDSFTAISAGSVPSGYIHPLAIETMSEMGIDISHNQSKSLDVYLDAPLSYIITVCDDAKEACPVFPGKPLTAHWGFEDPAKFEGTEEEKRHFFRKIAVEIERRIRLFLALPESMLSELEYQQAVRDIGNQ